MGLSEIIKLLEDENKEFSLVEFGQLTNFAQRINYCNDKLKRLGAGTSRVTYELDNNSVLKVAKNSKGIAQNNHEIYCGMNLYEDAFIQVKDADYDNDAWIIMEKADRVKSKDFDKYFGISMKETFGVIGEIHAYAMNKNNSYQTPNSKTLFEKLVDEEAHPFFSSLATYIYDQTPKSIGDFVRSVNYGIVTREDGKHLVIIDNGFSDEVMDMYYKRG